tara:strand:+ start:1053 stop:1448 length:396 start_codon:yes stop_codon:yes gene_type:complete
MELLQRYIKEVGADLVIDDFNLKNVQLKLPATKHFWVARLVEARVAKDKLIKSKKQRKKDIIKEVISASPIKISITAAEQAAEKHDAIMSIADDIKEYDLIITYLEKVEKILHQMTWDCKNIIEINKLETL